MSDKLEGAFTAFLKNEIDIADLYALCCFAGDSDTLLSVYKKRGMAAIIATFYKTLAEAKDGLSKHPFKRGMAIVKFKKGFLVVSKKQL